MNSTRRSLENLQQQFQQLDSALRTSFANLKRDVLEQEKTIEELKARSAEQDKFMKHLAAEIAELKKEAIGKPESDKSSSAKSTSIEPTSHQGLTPLHLQMLKHLMILQLEAGRRYVSMRELAEELYPDKPYSTIKATLSEYLKKLHQQGFIDKIRRGQLFLSFTEKALQFADNQRLNRMRDLISAPER